MGLNVGNLPVTGVYVGSTPVREVYVGSNLVWSATVQITLGTGNQARDQFRAALTERGLDHATITEVPFEIELVGTGSAQNMFESCWELESVPNLDTSGVTNMSSMFADCQSITHVPDMDTSNVTDMHAMFSGCGLLTHVPDMDTSKVTNMNYMFFVCTSLTDGNVRLIGRHPNVTTLDMVDYSGLTREPWYNADGTPLTPREVTINVLYGNWDQSTVTGDTSLIQEWIGSDQVRFNAPTRCDQRVYNATAGLLIISAGSTIPAGTPVKAYAYTSPNTFTEVL